MSKWHKVEIGSEKLVNICKEWLRYGKNTNLQGRMKIRSYRILVDIDGKKKKISATAKVTADAEKIIHVFKFKNDDEAMAFKLEWS